MAHAVDQRRRVLSSDERQVRCRQALLPVDAPDISWRVACAQGSPEEDRLGSTSGEQFAEDCRAAQPSQPTSIACELAYLSRKPEAEIAQALLRTRAFVSLLRCTGMRSITAVTLRLDQFTEAGSESGVLLKRH